MLHFGFTFALLAKHCPHVKGPLDSQLELVYIARLILHERAVGRNNLAAATGIRIAGRLSAAAGRNIFFLWQTIDKPNRTFFTPLASTSGGNRRVESMVG